MRVIQYILIIISAGSLIGETLGDFNLGVTIFWLIVFVITLYFVMKKRA